MKTSLLLCAALATAAQAAPILKRATAEDLTRLQKVSPVTTLEKPAADAVPVQKEEPSIVKDSVILHDGKNWTLVPKGAVIFLPPAQKDRVDVKPVGTLLPFPEFAVQNRSWITTNEVTFDQAAGAESLPAERTAFWGKQDKVVIAVHQGGPISVKVSAPAPATAQR